MFGIFSDEGIVADDFVTHEEASAWVLGHFDGDDGVHVAEVCHDHPEHEKQNCEECNAEVA